MKIQGNQYIQGLLKVNRRVIEGYKSVLVDTNYNLQPTSEKFFRFTSTSPCTVTLPDAQQLTSGFEFLFYTTSQGVVLNDFTGNKVTNLESGMLYYVYLMSGDEQAGEWVVSVDTSYDISVGVSSNPERGVRLYFMIDSEYNGSLQ